MSQDGGEQKISRITEILSTGDLIVSIAGFLTPEGVGRMGAVNRLLAAVLASNAFWYSRFSKYYPAAFQKQQKSKEPVFFGYYKHHFIENYLHEFKPPLDPTKYMRRLDLALVEAVLRVREAGGFAASLKDIAKLLQGTFKKEVEYEVTKASEALFRWVSQVGKPSLCRRMYDMAVSDLDASSPDGQVATVLFAAVFNQPGVIKRYSSVGKNKSFSSDLILHIMRQYDNVVNPKDQVDTLIACYAVKYGHRAVLEVLLDRDPEHYYAKHLSLESLNRRSLLHVAARGNQTDMVALLLGMGATLDATASGMDKNTPLQDAVGSDAAEAAQALANAKADINIGLSQRKLMADAISANNVRRVALLLGVKADLGEFYWGEVPLMRSIERGCDTAILNKLLNAKADPDGARKVDSYRGFGKTDMVREKGTPLVRAAGSDHLRAVESLLAAKANPDGVLDGVSGPGGITPLDEVINMRMCFPVQYHIVRALLAAKADTGRLYRQQKWSCSAVTVGPASILEAGKNAKNPYVFGAFHGTKLEEIPESNQLIIF
jgi:ankyrin repeat protein